MGCFEEISMRRKIVLLTFTCLVLIFACKTAKSSTPTVTVPVVAPIAVAPIPVTAPIPVAATPVTLTPTAIATPPPVTTVPMTDEILEQVRFNGYDVNDLQYFVSGTITLHRENTLSNNKVADDGQAIIRNKTIRDEIVISKLTPGIVAFGISLSDLQANEMRLELPIVFGDDNNNRLFFGKYLLAENKGEYRLLYHRQNQVKYGDDWYTVDYEGEEIPYLLIEKYEESIDENAKRIEPGRTLQ
jgi:hypothetical protein